VQQGIVWGFFALSVLVFIGRIWIRWISMRKLVKEDYLMLFVLCLQLATAIICQLRLRYVYMMEEVGNGLITPPPPADIPRRRPKGTARAPGHAGYCYCGALGRQVQLPSVLLSHLLFGGSYVSISVVGRGRRDRPVLWCLPRSRLL
jgi:hypothetical protein